VGPLAGGYLTEWTWRAIFWINVPVAVVAIILIIRAKPAEERRDARIDFRGAVLAAAALGLVVLGLQQSAVWGWADARTVGCLAVGAATLVGFVIFELRQAEPLVDLRMFGRRAFAADSAVLCLISAAFVPLFFFASVYAQASLGYSATEAGKLLLVFFGGFAAAGQLGGKILDERGARPAVVAGSLLAAVGFALWARSLPDMEFSTQWHWLALAGAGLGLVLGPVSADALNRAPDASYGEITGVTQTCRNIGASLGMAILGSLFLAQSSDRIETTLTGKGIPAAEADRVAHAVTDAGSHAGPLAGQAGAGASALHDAVRLDLAHATGTVVYVMAGIMLAAFVVSAVLLPKGRVAADAEEPAPVRAGVPA
jgi:predicted MFS family arabinose efflux permease